MLSPECVKVPRLGHDGAVLSRIDHDASLAMPRNCVVIEPCAPV